MPEFGRASSFSVYPQQITRSVSRRTSLVVATLLVALPAHADNPDTFTLSGDAALQGGAITADARGGGAVWYNPAGLAKLRGLRLDVSMSAYSLRLGGHPDVDASTPGTEVTRLQTADFSIVPAGLALTHRLGNIGVGFGVFAPTQETTFLRTQIVQPQTTTTDAVSFSVDANGRTTEYFAGPAAGFSLGKAVDVGASLLLHYRSDLSVGAFNVSITDASATTVSLTSHETVDWQQIGLEPVFGVQIHPTDTWQLGFTLRLPSLRLFEIWQSTQVETIATNFEDGDSNTSSFVEDNGISDAIVTPARFHAGLSHDFDKGRLAVEGSYQVPFHSEEVGADLRPLINGRVGGKYQWSDHLAVGGGVFSNRSAQRYLQTFGDSQIDYYGLTLGVDLGTRYSVSAREGKPVPAGSELVFGTTVALSYALGVGQVVRGELGTDIASGDLFREIPTDVTAHQLILHVGSSLLE